jgi:hypothetical protein
LKCRKGLIFGPFSAQDARIRLRRKGPKREP